MVATDRVLWHAACSGTGRGGWVPVVHVSPGPRVVDVYMSNTCHYMNNKI
jgi:hypothetical protein